MYIFYKVWTGMEQAWKYSVFVPYKDKFKNGYGGKSCDALQKI